MLVGTVVGVLVIPGLYYLFAKIGDGKRLIRDEHDQPITEILERTSSETTETSHGQTH
jgi:hypothetical protein